jgi:hypothetical protein
MVESIGNFCFGTTDSLCEVTFESESKLQRIGKEAFTGTCIKRIQIPPSVEFIGKRCFSDCKSLEEIIFEGSVKRIGKKAFDSSVKCVIVWDEVQLNYSFPANCRIEYIRTSIS